MERYSITDHLGRIVGEDEFRPERWPAGRGLSAAEAAIAVAALGVSGAAAAIVVGGGVVTNPTSYSVVLVASILALTSGGLLWLRFRPWSPFGKLLIALAGVDALCSLSGLPSPGPYTTGVVIGWLAALLSTYVIVGFPNGRLDRAAAAIVGSACAVFVFLQMPQFLVSSSVTGIAAVGRCAADCPDNPLLVASRLHTAHVLDVAEGIARAIVAAAIVAYLAGRFAIASRPRRRIVFPVYAASALFAAASGVSALWVDALGEGPPAEQWIRIAVVSTRIFFPLGFVAAILLAQAYAGTALSLMTRELSSGPSVGRVEALVRRVLDDPRARLAFWLPRLGRYADRLGRPVTLDPGLEQRTWHGFGHGRERVLAIQHDPALEEDPELVEAAGAATLMAVDNQRLQQDLLDSIAALRASQQRLVAAAATERRKIERDLHDGAQQKLVAIRIQLELAREQAPQLDGLRSRLAALGADLDDALDELRAVAHGIYPPLLADEGLTAALRDVALRAGSPVELELEEVGRLPEAIEAAVYYCCREALQNAVKHAGPDAAVLLRLAHDARELRFAVADDGLGFATPPHGSGLGLTSMQDRIGAVGGTLIVRSAPGEGTAVEGRVQLPSTEGRGDAERA